MAEEQVWGEAGRFSLRSPSDISVVILNRQLDIWIWNSGTDQRRNAIYKSNIK